MKLLVLGASGFIGRHILAESVQRNIPSIGTYYKTSPDQKNKLHLVHFDFCSSNMDDFLEEHAYGEENLCAVICSANAKINDCFTHREETYFLNVTRTKLIIDSLNRINAKIIFISSSSVFNGRTPFPNELDEACPPNEYGRQKKEVEDYLSQTDDHLIVRLPHVVSGNIKEKHILQSTLSSLLRGEDMYYIKDYVVAPTDVDDVVKVLMLLLEDHKKGLFHISSPNHYTYAQFIKTVAGHFNFNNEIIEKPIDFFNFKDKRTLNAVLDSSKIHELYPFDFCRLEDILSGMNIKEDYLYENQ